MNYFPPLSGQKKYFATKTKLGVFWKRFLLYAVSKTFTDVCYKWPCPPVYEYNWPRNESLKAHEICFPRKLRFLRYYDNFIKVRIPLERKDLRDPILGLISRLKMKNDFFGLDFFVGIFV